MPDHLSHRTTIICDCRHIENDTYASSEHVYTSTSWSTESQHIVGFSIGLVFQSEANKEKQKRQTGTAFHKLL